MFTLVLVEGGGWVHGCWRKDLGEQGMRKGLEMKRERGAGKGH